MLMAVVLIGIASVCLELINYSRFIFFKLKKETSISAILLICFFTGSLAVYLGTAWVWLIELVNLYRILNLTRIYKQRMNDKFLLKTTRTTGLVLAVIGVVGGLLVLSTKIVNSVPRTRAELLIFACFDAFIAALILYSAIRNILKTTPLPIKLLDTNELPSLSICIPARNETDELNDCLLSLVQSNYPKLEIIVLDDCSQGKYTSEVIRSFAHDGVRFIQGSPPDDHWLAKNWADEQLLKEASGDYVVFCGVDIRFSRDSLRKLVSLIVKKDKAMISIVPDRRDDLSSARLIQPMRYFWELAPPRRQFNRPPVLSSCWIAKSSDLNRIGGFSAATRSIVPEAYFAQTFLKHDGYGFCRDGNWIGLSSEKAARSQRKTAVRVRYPQLHRRPELVLATGLIELSLLLLPFVGIIIGIAYRSYRSLLYICAFGVLLLIVSYAVIGISTLNRRFTAYSLLFPVAVLLDIGLMNYSMIMYEFSKVSWKSRNVCIPAMHAYQTPSKIT